MATQFWKVVFWALRIIIFLNLLKYNFSTLQKCQIIKLQNEYVNRLDYEKATLTQNGFKHKI